MGESNAHWGGLAAHDDVLADVYDGFDTLPEAGVNDVLDAFVASKGITIPALVRLGTRLADYRVLAFPFEGGLKYRDMESGRRWAATDSEFTRLKIVRAGAKPSDTVIIAEGETDGARLTMLYPGADVAVLPAGAKRWQPGFTEQMLPYERVLVGLDNDEAGEEGAAKVAAAVPQAQRFAPPGSNDWCAHEGEPPAFPEPPAEQDRAGGVLFRDLGPAWRGELRTPEVIVDDLLYDEGVHWVSGHPGSGKSLMAMFMAWAAMVDKRHVVWLDYEQGERMTGQRLREMGVPLELVQAYFHWAWYPAKAEDELVAIAERFPNALIVIDSASKALAGAGIEENENSEVTAWTIKLIQMSKSYRVPVVVIDHVSKSNKGPYARGAGAKHADTDVHWHVEKLEEFNRTTIGIIGLKQAKDREGYLPLKLFFKVGDGAGGLAIEPTDDPANETNANDDAPTI